METYTQTSYKLILGRSGGSDWIIMRVLSVDLASGEASDLDDKLEFVKFSTTAWTQDNKVSLAFPGFAWSQVYVTGSAGLKSRQLVNNLKHDLIRTIPFAVYRL